MKYTDVRYPFMRTVERTKVKKIGTINNPPFILTKLIPSRMFMHCLDLISIDRRR